MTTKQFSRIIKDRKLFASILLIIVGIFILVHDLLRDKVKSKAELIEIQSTLRDYSFIENKGFRRHIIDFQITLDDYEPNFKIIADFADYFNRNLFERTVIAGDTLRVFISKRDYLNIDRKQKIKTFGIYKNNTTFLNLEQSIAQDNNDLLMYSGLFFLFIGIMIFNRNKNKLRTEK